MEQPFVNNIDRLKRSISMLIVRNNNAEKNNAKLQSVIEQQEIELQNAKDRIKQLEAELTSVVVSRSVLEIESGYKGARSRINAMIRDIDRCISLLNKG